MNAPQTFDAPSAAAPTARTFPTGRGQNHTHDLALSDGRTNPAPHAGQPYATLTGAEIVAMVENPPPAVPKDRAQWFIPSAYFGFDARRGEAQLERGSFSWLTLDVDTNNLLKGELIEALAAVLGNYRFLIYSTSSATPDNRKWRGLVPLLHPLDGAEFKDTQEAFFDLLSDATQGTLIADTALRNPNQLVYLPNPLSGLENYDRHVVREAPRLDLSPLHPVILRREENRAKRAEADRAAEIRRKKREAERAARPFDQGETPIEAFNTRHAVGDLLGRYGYTRAGQSNDWRSPCQTGKSFATRDMGDYWVSLSGSDANAGLGHETRSGARHGDAFDLYCHFDHGGDMHKAVAAYGAEMRQCAPPDMGRCAGWTPQDGDGEAECPPPLPNEAYACADAKGGEESRKPTRKVAFFLASDLHGQTVPARQWLVVDLIPSGTVTMLGGDGGTGKSLLALQLAASVAHGGFPWLGHHPECGTAIFLSAEDDRDELHRRVADVARAEGVSLAEMGKLHLLSLAGEDALMATLGPDGSINRTALANALESHLLANPSKIVVLDTLADLYPGNENDRAQARQFIGLCRGIAIRQSCAILLLAHPSLSGLNSGAGTSGSTAWNNSVRSRLYLERVIQDNYEPNPDARVLTTKKANYGRTGGEISMTWRDGVFVADPVETGLDRMAASMKAERVFLKLLRQTLDQGRRVNHAGGPTHAAKVFAGMPEAEGVNKRAFGVAMERLLQAGKIVIGQDGPPSKRRQFLAFPGEVEASDGGIRAVSDTLAEAAE